MEHLVDKLYHYNILTRNEYVELLSKANQHLLSYANRYASSASVARFGKEVFTRGLIEISNYCRNNCFYCGIRWDNRNIKRYRLCREQVLECCRLGHSLHINTFVLQSGEDPETKAGLIELIKMIRAEFPNVAITLSLGEWEESFYRDAFEAGASRYLLRHEAANHTLYTMLHPSTMRLSNRMECLYNLKEIGYQTGVGMMVGVPGQTIEHLADDLIFIQHFRPHMVGIGPFIPAYGTPFHAENPGNLNLTLMLISIIRLMLPDALIPATTSLATLSGKGYEQGILAGANVVMPNLLPQEYKKLYKIYNNKACIEDSPEELFFGIKNRIEKIGYRISDKKGDYKKISDGIQLEIKQSNPVYSS